MRRNLDGQGRLVIPIELKREIGLENGSEVNMELQDSKIILTNPKSMKTREEVESKLKDILNRHYKTDDSEIHGFINALEWVLNEERLDQ